MAGWMVFLRWRVRSERWILAFSTGPSCLPGLWAVGELGCPGNRLGAVSYPGLRALAKAAQWPWPSSEPLPVPVSAAQRRRPSAWNTVFLLLPSPVWATWGPVGLGQATWPGSLSHEMASLGPTAWGAARHWDLRPLARPGPPRVSYSLGIDLQEHCYLTVIWPQEQKDLTRTLQQLTTPPPSPFLEKDFAESFWGFRYFKVEATHLVAWPSTAFPFALNSERFVVVWPHCAKGTQTCISVAIHESKISVIPRLFIFPQVNFVRINRLNGKI